MSASDILRTAADIVSGARQRVHGPDREDFRKIAVLWNAWLAVRRDPAAPLDAGDVAQMMALLKAARSCCGEFNLDDFLDMAGYAGIAGELAGKDAK